MQTAPRHNEIQSQIELLIRARYPILYIISSEEMRVQNLVVEIAKKRQKKTFEWSYSTGIVPAGTSIQSQKHRNAATMSDDQWKNKGHRGENKHHCACACEQE